MEKVFGYTYGGFNFEIFKKSGLYYLKLDKVLKLRTDNIDIARSYIDGFIEGRK